MLKRHKISLFLVLISCFLVFLFTYWNGMPFILCWDTFGYSAYLPMGFIHHSLVLHDLSFFEKINQLYDNTPTLYQFTQLQNGDFITRHSMGWSIAMSPFFLLATALAKIFRFPIDGYSAPFEYVLSIGSSLYTLFGLFFLRKNLLHYFSDRITTITLFIVIFGTNYWIMQSVSIGSTHNLIFAYFSALIWFTIQFHKKPSIKKGVALGFCIGMIGLIRPPDLILALIPIGWCCRAYGGLWQKGVFFWTKNRKPLITGAATTLLLLFLQTLYWKITAGHFLLNSYNNNGEGFDWFHPHILELLFSFRKGWILYTPIMVFAVIGLFYWKKKESAHGNSVLLAFFLFLYLVSCWTNWWYADSYSQRPMLDSYPVLAIGLGFFLSDLKRIISKIVIGSILLALLSLNLFQSFQFNKGILHASLMTKAYYFSIFGQRTRPSAPQKKLLLIDKVEAMKEGFKNPQDYRKTYSKKYYFPPHFSLNDTIVFTPFLDIPPLALTKKDHFWIRSIWQYEGNSAQLKGKIVSAAAMHNHKSYGWKGQDSENPLIHLDTVLKKITFEYLSPDLRSEEDLIRLQIWKMAGPSLRIHSVLIEGYEPKNTKTPR
jgi:hypothetical protein